MITLLNRKKKFKSVVSNWRWGEGKLRDLGMVFKPSFKCLKNKKINLSPAFLKLETLLFPNMFLLFHLILYSQSDFDSKKKSGLREKKNVIYELK